MFVTLQILTLILVAVAVTTSLAHALEFPGKLRLSEGEYLAIQPIYYPGFTIAGAAEPLGLLALLVLIFLTPREAPFWLTLGAFIALLAAHAIYWLVTHPVNNFWLADVKLKGPGAGFFKSDPLGRGNPAKQATPPDWTQLRDRWEYSHLARAVFALLALILFAAAVAL